MEKHTVPTKKQKSIHFIGIGGIGVSALARFANFNGHKISGSDIKESVLTKKLESEGIKVTVPHSKEAINKQDLVIYSAAIKSDNVELMEANNLNIQALSRKEALKIILSDMKNFCVCGAHGKSTTTAILTAILQNSALIGAESKEFDSNFRFIGESLSFEADESDSSFLNSNPYCAVVTNAEPEHMEHYDYDLGKFHQAYIDFLNMAQIRVINAEDEFLSTLDKIEATRLYPSRDIKNIEFELIDGEPFTKFSLLDFGEFEVWGFGDHIALDASLAILAALNEIDIDKIRVNLKKYRGIKKRFDVLWSSDKCVLIDDYAHHPTEVEATMQSVILYKELKKFDKIIAIWQPHKFSRVLSNMDHFRECFDGCDELVILPVWAAGEPYCDIDFAALFEKYNPILADKIKVRDRKIDILRDSDILKTYDSSIIIGFGAGDITYQLRGLK
jgi:UDP-N-acetylmuramate--alanine ligase